MSEYGVMTEAPRATAHPYPFDQPTPVDPSPLFAALRNDEPVCRVTLPWGDTAYLVTRFQDAHRVLSDPVFSFARVWSPAAPRLVAGPPPHAARSVPNLDPPGHTRMRRVVSPAFTPRRLESMRAYVQRSTGGLLDRMAAAGPPADLVRDWCAPLTVTVICKLVGVPPQDRETFRAWSDAIAGVTDGTEEEWRRAWQDLAAYVRRLIVRKREKPAGDVLSDLTTAFDEDDALTEADLITLAVQLLIDGHQTTLDQFRKLAYALLSRPGLYTTLNVHQEKVPAAVEELLRLHAHDEPIMRVATEEVSIAGVTVPAGSLVVIEAPVVNRDPAIFEHAEDMDVSRADNNHLTFGHGPHHCLGAALARLELQVAVASLTRRFPTLRLAVAPENVTWRAGQTILGIQELPVTWDEPYREPQSVRHVEEVD
jgi:nocardicin N-oxygenase